MRVHKVVAGVLIGLFLAFPGVALGKQDALKATNIKANVDSIGAKQTLVVDNCKVTVVTDPAELNKQAKVFGAEAPAGKKLKRIEFYEPLTTPTEQDLKI